MILEQNPNVSLGQDLNSEVATITTEKRWPSLIYSFLFILLWLSLARFYRDIANSNALLAIAALAWFFSSLFIIAAFLWEFFGTETLYFDDKKVVQVFSVAFLPKRTRVFMYDDIESIEQGKNFKAKSIGQLRNPLFLRSNCGCVFLRMKAEHKDAYLGIDLSLQHSAQLIGMIHNQTNGRFST